MKDAFARNAQEVCGPCIVIYRAAAAKVKRGAKQFYYFLSPSRYARHLASSGIVRFVTLNGMMVNFTDRNRSGKKPSRDATLVLCGFGADPVESVMRVDALAYAAHKRRRGLARRRSVLLDQRDRAAAKPAAPLSRPPAPPKRSKNPGKKFG